MNRTIQSALISVFYKDGLEPIVRKLHALGVQLYSTGGTKSFIEGLGIPCTPVESVTDYPSILGGRVKTLHPKIFGGILARRDHEQDRNHVQAYNIPMLDLVIVDLYPFEETVAQTADEHTIIEKIDIGGVSLIRAAAKNYKDVLIVADRSQYGQLETLLDSQKGATTVDDRRTFAAAAFATCAHYDIAIADYFNGEEASRFLLSVEHKQSLRYGENPHQQAAFYGDVEALFEKLNGKELSYNNLVDVDAACSLIQDLDAYLDGGAFAIIKHTNVCGVAMSDDVLTAWKEALAGDPESAFGGVLVTNLPVTRAVAEEINALFFEILIAPGFEPEALELLRSKKNRMLLKQRRPFHAAKDFKRVLEGVLVQEKDDTNYADWNEVGGRETTDSENADLLFANIVCKHLKSNAIALVKNRKLIGKGCGQTSRIDALRQSVEKARQFGFDLKGAVLASDAFFPFDDSARLAHEVGITAIIQPGGSMRDSDTINFCKEHNMAMILTGMRHFRH